MVQTSNGKATASLVLGIVGIFMCPAVCSVLALILGYAARNEIAASGGSQRGDSNATAGIILGWVGIVFAIIWITIVIIAIAVAASTACVPFFPF